MEAKNEEFSAAGKQFEGRTDAALVEEYVSLTDALAVTEERSRALYAEIFRRMEENAATWLSTPDFDVRIVGTGRRQYDPNRVRAALGELIEPDLLERLIVPEHEETKAVPARVDGNVARQVRKLGQEAQDALDGALLPQRTKLEIERKETG